ncbi:MAG: citrate synthase [Candidatus Margulisiibacteriota bacterium]
MLDQDLLSLKDSLLQNNSIDESMYDHYDVKRGLRNKDGSGVIAGLTKISAVVGQKKVDDKQTPVDGVLKYRGYMIEELIRRFPKGSRYCFEITTFLLLAGRFPTEKELKTFIKDMCDHRELSPDIMNYVIKGFPSKNVMNKLQVGVSALYSEDENPDSLDAMDNFHTSLKIIAKLPSIIAYSYLNAYKDNPTFAVAPKEMSVAESFLFMLNEGKPATEMEAYILDLCLVLHAEHGGGNNSTFATRVVTSSGSDIYSSLTAGIGSLKGPLHGAANKKVMDMMDDIKANVSKWHDMDELKGYLTKIIQKKVGDKSGKLYGLGHAVYTLSDPRALLVKEHAINLATSKGRMNELQLYFDIEREAPELFKAIKGSDKVIAPNIDFFTGFVYDCLGIDSPLYTSIFAMARSAGWCAHRIEELLSGKRIIRPGYKYVG